MQFSGAHIDPVSFETRRRVRSRAQICQIIWHTAVDGKGPMLSLRGWWERVGFATTGSVSNGGRVVQYYRDACRKPGGTRDADDRALTFETEDDGDPEGNPWTAPQLDAIVRVCDEACIHFGIPRKAIEPDRRFLSDDPRRWRTPGIGDHTLPHWADNLNKTGWLETAGRAKLWTRARGKTCVGSTRAHQLYLDVIPRVAALEAAPLRYGVDILKLGSSGEAVETLQTILRTHYDRGEVGVDGEFGPITETAVCDVQADLGVTVDGMWGPESARASWIERQNRRDTLHPMPYGEWFTGPDVNELRARFGYGPGPYSTWFVNAVVVPWQTRNGLDADGVFGRDDWQRILAG